jgi:hypothetical protein
LSCTPAQPFWWSFPSPRNRVCVSAHDAATLNWDINFPHIFAAVLTTALDESDDDTIRSLRLANCSIRDFIDQRIIKHAVLVLEPRRVYTYTGHVQLSFDDGNVAAQVVTLDVQRGSAARQSPPDEFHTDAHFSTSAMQESFPRRANESLTAWWQASRKT